MDYLNLILSMVHTQRVVTEVEIVGIGVNGVIIVCWTVLVRFLTIQRLLQKCKYKKAHITNMQDELINNKTPSPFT